MFCSNAPAVFGTALRRDDRSRIDSKCCQCSIVPLNVSVDSLRRCDVAIASEGLLELMRETCRFWLALGIFGDEWMADGQGGLSDGGWRVGPLNNNNPHAIIRASCLGQEDRIG